MDQEIIDKLLKLNHKFYQTFAKPFSSTRQRLQPGVQQILKQIPQAANILDLGCGNGEVWCRLISGGYHGNYVGIDSSRDLLNTIPSNYDESLPDFIPEIQEFFNTGDIIKSITVKDIKATFIQANLSKDDWDSTISNSPFNFVFAFALLHHIPDYGLRCHLLRKVKNLLSPTGRFIHSEWQFLNSPRLKSRIQPWESVGISPDEVDPGDYLLDWRRGGYGLRYVHFFNQAELATLAEESGFRIMETFLSDGEGGNLGLYQKWEII